MPTLKYAEFGKMENKSYVLSIEAPTTFHGICYANIRQSSMKKVSVVDTATQTDPITILDSSIQFTTRNPNSKTQELQRQTVQTDITNKSRTKTSIEEKKAEAGLEKTSHHEMIRKHWKKQQQKERKARSQSSPPTKDQTKLKSSQGTQRPITSNRERKGSNDVI